MLWWLLGSFAKFPHKIVNNISTHSHTQESCMFSCKDRSLAYSWLEKISLTIITIGTVGKILLLGEKTANISCWFLLWRNSILWINLRSNDLGVVLDRNYILDYVPQIIGKSKLKWIIVQVFELWFSRRAI